MVLGVVAVVQWTDSKKQRQKMEELQIQVEKSASAAKAETRVKELEKERLKLIGELRAAEFELNSARMAAAAGQNTNAVAAARVGAGRTPNMQGEGGGGMGKMIGNMLKDPEMRKVMEQQQRMGMDMIYGSLVKKLQLTPEQEKQFKDILLSQQIENMEQAGALMEGDSTQRAKIAEELAEKRKANEEKIKEAIGEENFAEYQEYNQTIGERMMLEQFGKNLEATPEQTEQLLGIFREEKQNVQINLGNPLGGDGQDWQAMLGSDEASQKFFQQQEEVNARVLERAAQVLSPEQLQKFGPVLKNQLEMQQAGFRMARQMFEKKSEPATPNAQ